ncbi:MAG: YfgM family protein [Desulfopila sp.]
MSAENAFDKRYVDPKDQSKIEGLLELFNLPPKVIAFLRVYRWPLQIGLVAAVIGIVGWSVYGSYRERQIENGASALSLALQEVGPMRKEALDRVVQQFDSTSSATWAQVELANLAMADKDFAAASAGYTAVNEKVERDNPLFALTLYGIAESEEARGGNDAAYAAFDRLKAVPGYELVGYTGMARIYLAKGQVEKALGIYGQYLAMLGDSPEDGSKKAFIEAKIAQIKARQ